MASPAPFQKTTVTIAHHSIPIECDIYDAADYPSTTPVLLFFHSGGLVAGARNMVPPWLAQTCLLRKWPLLSASYRLLPQASGSDLHSDALAAYSFAASFQSNDFPRRVIVAGASAGFFLASVIAQHTTTQPPLALLSITGIPTFRHDFFNSSVLIPSEPITDDEVSHFLTEPLTVGRHIFDPSAVFSPSSILPSGLKNTSFIPAKQLLPGFTGDPNRGMLYEYYLYENLFLDLVGDVDKGFDWARRDEEKRQAWPVTIFIHGDEDDDVSPDVCMSVAEKLGHRVVYCKARGKGHLFERGVFLEDLGEDMETPEGAVLKAIDAVDQAVRDGKGS